MGVLRKFKVKGRNREFDSFVVNTPKSRANRIRKGLKKRFGNDVHVRVVKARGKGYDVFTDPPEEEFAKIARKRRKKR